MSFSLVEFTIVDDALLVLAVASALLESFQHLSPEADLPQLPIGHHIQHQSSSQSPFLN
jgi:hypothetical protein